MQAHTARHAFFKRRAFIKSKGDGSGPQRHKGRDVKAALNAGIGRYELYRLVDCVKGLMFREQRIRMIPISQQSIIGDESPDK